MKLLSVDDSKTIRETIQQMIAALNVEYLEAENGQQALDILAAHNGEIDLIILDWEMPVMNGMEFLKIVKNSKQYQAIPVIMLTAVSQREKMIEAVRAGAKQYITKPFSSEDLQIKIIQALGITSVDELRQ